jgi:hypothetical protein
MGGLALCFGLDQETAVPKFFDFFWVSYGREDGPVYKEG